MDKPTTGKLERGEAEQQESQIHLQKPQFRCFFVFVLKVTNWASIANHRKIKYLIFLTNHPKSPFFLLVRWICKQSKPFKPSQSHRDLSLSLWVQWICKNFKNFKVSISLLLEGLSKWTKPFNRFTPSNRSKVSSLPLSLSLSQSD